MWNIANRNAILRLEHLCLTLHKSLIEVCKTAEEDRNNDLPKRNEPVVVTQSISQKPGTLIFIWTFLNFHTLGSQKSDAKFTLLAKQMSKIPHTILILGCLGS